MSESLYELLALCARYIFAGLMVLIVARAWRITIIDGRRAKTLRRISPETGIIGEMMVMEGDEKARRGMKYKVIREGQIGSSRRADIRIRHSSVRRRHAYFLLTEEGLRVRSHAGAPLKDGRGRQAKEVLLRDGDYLHVGRVHLMLILTQAPEAGRIPASRRRVRRDGGPVDDMFDPDDDLFESGNDFFKPEDDLFSGYDTARQPSRRHLPLTLEEGPGLHTVSSALRPGRRYGSGEPTAQDLRRPAAARVEDNPLNRRRPQNTVGHASDSLFTEDDEMW